MKRQVELGFDRRQLSVDRFLERVRVDRLRYRAGQCHCESYVVPVGFRFRRGIAPLAVAFVLNGPGAGSLCAPVNGHENGRASGGDARTVKHRNHLKSNDLIGYVFFH